MPAEPTRGLPISRRSIAADLEPLGVPPGAIVLVHASLSSIGWVVGGEQALLQALRDAIGAAGTLVMPTQSWQLCDPAYLNDPSIPRSWWQTIRDELPPYDVAATPTRTMGVAAELFRRLPGSVRSAHPHRSFAANGPAAEAVVRQHELTSPVGEGSPLRALYDLGAMVLLLGVGHDKVTALHLAEHRCEYPGKHLVRNGAPLNVEGQRRWITWRELWVADDDFDAVGEAFAGETGLVVQGRVGLAAATLLPLPEVVDFAARWFPVHRDSATFSHDTTGW